MRNCAVSGRYVHVPDHPFRTGRYRERMKPVGKFDPWCADAKLGFRDFSPSPMIDGA
jgi:hypothetical protein